MFHPMAELSSLQRTLATTLWQLTPVSSWIPALFQISGCDWHLAFYHWTWLQVDQQSELRFVNRFYACWVKPVFVCMSLYLLESISCNSLEGLVHVDSFFGTGLKIRDVVFALTPCLGTFCRHLLKAMGSLRILSIFLDLVHEHECKKWCRKITYFDFFCKHGRVYSLEA